MELEARGVPTVTLATQYFEALARITAKGKRLPDLPLTILPHPLNPLPDGQIREAVRKQAGRMVEALTRVKQPIKV
ncbi:MAG: hypothetical protein AAB369_00535 [Chloroflexota bacterium]